MNEHSGIQRIHDKTRKSNTINRHRVRVWKVRDDFTAGVLDCQYINRIGLPIPPLYIEYKYVKELPKRDTTDVLPKWHSDEQKSWANELNNGINRVLIGIIFGSGRDAGIVFLKNGEWNEGITTYEAKQRAIELNSSASLIEEICLNAGEINPIIERFEGNYEQRKKT